MIPVKFILKGQAGTVCFQTVVFNVLIDFHCLTEILPGNEEF